MTRKPSFTKKPWLTDFIRNPGSAQHYGAKNQMPTFEGKMTEKQLDLLTGSMADEGLLPDRRRGL